MAQNCNWYSQVCRRHEAGTTEDPVCSIQAKPQAGGDISSELYSISCRSDVKVAQFAQSSGGEFHGNCCSLLDSQAGYIAEHSAYHHGSSARADVRSPLAMLPVFCTQGEASLCNP